MGNSADVDRDVRVFIYRLFIEQGFPPSVADTARGVDVPADEVRMALERLAEAHMLVLKPGTHEIWMANPLSAVPTSFRVTTAQGSWWANCIWDALGVPAMLDTAATVATICPDCEEPQTLRVHDDSLDPVDGVVQFSVPAARWWDDIGYT